MVVEIQPPRGCSFSRELPPWLSFTPQPRVGPNANAFSHGTTKRNPGSPTALHFTHRGPMPSLSKTRPTSGNGLIPTVPELANAS